MKGMHYIYLWTLVWALMACTSHEDELQTDEEIRLNATVGEITSRATLTPSPYRGATPTADNPLKAWVWFSENSSTFSDTETDTETHLPCRTVMEFKGITVDAKNTDGANLKYGSVTKNNVYCVGFYPVYKDENARTMFWSTTDGTNVTADIDGITDLMFASHISGKWGTPMSNQTYKHLQSWVKINICATSQDAVTAWEGITKITVNSKKKVKVNLAATLPVGYETDGEIVIFEKTEGETPMYLQTTMEEVGSVFCSPALSFTVNFTIGGKTVCATITPTAFEDVTLESEEDAKGKLFVLTFYFNEFGMIEGVCTLNAWEAQNEDLYMKPGTTTQTP